MNRFRAVATVALACVMLGGLSGCVNSSSSSSGPLSITTTSIPATATVGSAYAGATISASGGTPPLSFTLSSGQLPSGITLSRTGSISGTPTSGWNFHVCGASARFAQSPAYCCVVAIHDNG